MNHFRFDHRQFYRTASSPNLFLPISLLVYDGSEQSKIGENNSPVVSSGEPIARNNVSQSNYLALKSTDDMFKGGPEQSLNSTDEKLQGLGVIGKVVEWKTQKVKEKRKKEKKKNE